MLGHAKLCAYGRSCCNSSYSQYYTGAVWYLFYRLGLQSAMQGAYNPLVETAGEENLEIRDDEEEKEAGSH